MLFVYGIIDIMVIVNDCSVKVYTIYILTEILFLIIINT